MLNRLHILSNIIRPLFGSWMVVLCYLKSVELGKGAKFYSFPIIRKRPGSVISIGNRFTCISNSKSNLIGINRKSVIATMTPKSILRIGHNCGISGAVITAFDLIEIGDDVKVGANSLITDSDWHPEDKRSGEPAAINIQSNVWIGEGVRILKGVSIGENTLIGAGSVVVKSIPANVVAAGNPCRVIRKL